MKQAADTSARDTAIICCYFNPTGYVTKKENYEHFAEEVRGKGKLFTIECAFGTEAFELPRRATDIRIRSKCVLWQKERLLNVLLSTLPKQYSKVVWLDCDLLFTNHQWLNETSRALDEFAVVQPFEVAVRLPQEHTSDLGEGQRYESYGSIFARDPMLAEPTKPGQRHGHTGFAWAARREVLMHGLYDACISGNGDHLMAHAFAGNWETRCFQRHFDESPKYRDHFESWCRRIYPSIRARLGFVPGKLLHLWHGEHEHRRYMDRNRELNAFAFDPDKDLRVGKNGCYLWNSQKPDLHKWAVRYFSARYEDGATIAPVVTRDSLVDRISRAIDRSCSPEHSKRLREALDSVKTIPLLDDAIVAAKTALGISPDEEQR